MYDAVYGYKLWWNCSEQEAYKMVFGNVTQLNQETDFVRSKNTRHARLYANDDYTITNPVYALVNINSMTQVRQPRLTLNIIRSCVDTLLAKICKNKINPMFMTSGGTFKAEMQARQLNKFMNGLFYQTDFHTVAAQCKRDEFIFGTGCAHIFEDRQTNQVKVERVFPTEILVDPNDSIYGKPQSMYRVRFLPRDYLRTIFPEHETAINQAKGDTFNRGRNFMEVILVYDAYHLPNGEKPGRHIFGIETCSFSDEEYMEDDFPFVFSRYSDPILGFFGIGIPEELTGIQIELNRILMHIQTSMRLSASPKIFIEEGSAINPLHFTSDPGIIIKYRGTPPIYHVNPSVHPDQFQQVHYLETKGYGIVGISELTATGTKPSGLNSGKALDTYHDIETERFSQTARRYEEFHLKCAKKMVDLVHKIYENQGEYEVSSFSRKGGLEKIDFDDIKIDKDGYIMQVFPVSDLPSTPTGKLKFVQEMTASGFIEPMMAMDLLDMPDTDRYTQFTLSAFHSMVQDIEEMLDTGEFISPEPYDDLQLCLKWGNYYYHWAKQKKMGEKSLDLLRAWISKTEELITLGQPMAPQQPQMPPSMQAPDQAAQLSQMPDSAPMM